MLYTFFDTETSGIKDNPDVLSMSYMLADEHLNVQRAETLYFWKEGVTKWTEEAYQVNKLSKDFLRQYSEDYEKNLRKMYIVLSYADLVGYNSGWIGKDDVIYGFDFPVCKSFLVRNGLEAPKPCAFHDVMRTYMRHHGGVRRKLTTAFNEYGLSESLVRCYVDEYFKGEGGNYHEAAWDTVCTALLFAKFYKDGWMGKAGVADLSYDMEYAPDNQYEVYFEELTLMVRDVSTGKTTTLADLAKSNPILSNKITSNISSYLVSEV